MESIVSMQHITKQYPDFSMNDINMELPKGMIMGLIGENGAGKSTLINLLLHEIDKQAGVIQIFGKDMEKNEKEIKQDIGVVFDECNFIETFKAVNLDKIMRGIYTNWDSNYYTSLLERFHLPLQKRIKDYSKGMKMKLSFAVALAHHPKLLILDEATTGLDPVMRDEVLEILQDFMQDEEHGVLLSSHITSDLEKIADYITFIHDGRILFSTTKDDLLYNHGILRCGEAVFQAFAPADMVAYRKEDYEWRILVKDRKKMQQKFPDQIIDQPTIDDIMLFHIKGEVVK